MRPSHNVEKGSERRLLPVIYTYGYVLACCGRDSKEDDKLVTLKKSVAYGMCWFEMNIYVILHPCKGRSGGVDHTGRSNDRIGAGLKNFYSASGGMERLQIFQYDQALRVRGVVDATRLGAWLRFGEGIGWLAAGTMPNSLY